MAHSHAVDAKTFAAARVLSHASCRAVRRQPYDWRADGARFTALTLRLDDVGDLFAHHLVSGALLLVNGLLLDLAEATGEPVEHIADRLALAVEMYEAIGQVCCTVPHAG